MIDKELIRILKERQKKMVDQSSLEVKEFLEEYGDKNCDYLEGRRLRYSYYRGSLDILNELEKEIDNG